MPTAEVPVTNLYRDEILERRALPMPPRRLHAVLPAREDVGRPRRARHQARPPVRQGRDGEVRAPGDSRTPSCDSLARRRRGRLPPARPRATASSQMCTGDLSFVAAHEVRRRGLGAGLRRVARGELVLELPRLPGPPRQHPLSPGREGEAGARAHAERLRPGAAARADRRARELPARRRQRRPCPRCSGRTPAACRSSSGDRDSDFVNRSASSNRRRSRVLCRSRSESHELLGVPNLSRFARRRETGPRAGIGGRFLAGR